MGPAEHDGMMGRAWHEASVATLGFFNDQGVRLKTIYVARMPEPSKATTVASLEQELIAVLRERPDLNIVFASDGAAPQWTALEGIAAVLSGRFEALHELLHRDYMQRVQDAA